MFRIRFLCAALALLSTPAQALEVDCDAAYCFSGEDFSQQELEGICITQLPQSDAGTMMLGSRVLRPGDILTAEQLAQMTFVPLRTADDRDAVMTYLPIYADRVEKSTTMTISIRGKEDKAPAAEDFSLETYKNLPAQGALKVKDPEGLELCYTVTRQPKRGELTVNADGTFVYTPKKNKVGVDSFVFTATDPAGNVSREATVTVKILKPTDSRQYTDTVGLDCRFEAEWMKNTGLFVGEQVGGMCCFYPDKTVSRGDFLAMVVKLLEIPVEEADYTGMTEDVPQWLKPYLAAAMRSGLLSGTPGLESGSFDAQGAISAAEAAVMVQNVLDLPVTTAVETVAEGKTDTPTWADTALQVMNDNGIALEADGALTRGQVAKMLYQISKLAEDAPGMTVVRKQN